MSIVTFNTRARVGADDERSLPRAPRVTCTVMCTSNAKLRVSCPKVGKVDISLNDGAPETWDARALEAALLARYAKELLRLVAPRPDARAAESAFSPLRRGVAAYGPQGRPQDYLRPTPQRQQRWAADLAQNQQQLGNIGTVIGGLPPTVVLGVLAALSAARSAVVLPNFANWLSVRGSGALFAPLSAGGSATGPLGPARPFPDARALERPIPLLSLPEGERNTSSQAFAPIVFGDSETTQTRAFAAAATSVARAHAVCYVQQADVYWEAGDAELVIAAAPNPPGFYANTSLALARLCCEERSAPEADALAGEIGQCLFGESSRVFGGQSGPYPYSQFSTMAASALLALTGSTTVIAIRKAREARALAAKIAENEGEIARLRVELRQRQQVKTYIPPDKLDELTKIKKILEEMGKLQESIDSDRMRMEDQEAEAAKHRAELVTLEEELAEATVQKNLMKKTLEAKQKETKSIHDAEKAAKESAAERDRAIQSQRTLEEELKNLRIEHASQLRGQQEQIDLWWNQLANSQLAATRELKNLRESNELLTADKVFLEGKLEARENTLALIKDTLDDEHSQSDDSLRLALVLALTTEEVESA